MEPQLKMEPRLRKQGQEGESDQGLACSSEPWRKRHLRPRVDSLCERGPAPGTTRTLRRGELEVAGQTDREVCGEARVTAGPRGSLQ